jgi:prepilin-type N-terminal cleavage/methylation domain-containing protein
MGFLYFQILKCLSMRRAFTLMELSIVLLVLSLLAAAGLRAGLTRTDATNMAALNSSLDVIETALMNYRNANGRLPCPADITSAENNANFGKENGTPGICVGPFNASDPDSSDPSKYDPATLNQVTSGALPTKELKLPDKYAYDPWGRKILYVVDIRITNYSPLAFTNYPVNSPSTAGTIGAIVVKTIATDVTNAACATYAASATNPVSTACLDSAATYKAIYALVSFGKNGHGGYVRNISGTSTRYNAASTNTDEWKNCHCTSSATYTAGTFDRIFVQKSKTNSPTTLSNSFDDVVRFKTRAQMASPSELQ